MTYVAHQGKVMNEKNNEGKRHRNRNYERNVPETAGRTGRKRYEHRKQVRKRKLEETRKSKSTRTSEECIFLQREIIDAIRKSEEKMEIYSGKTDEKMNKFLQTITDSVGTQLHEMNSTIVKRKKLECRLKMRGLNAPQSRSRMHSSTPRTSTKETKTSDQRTC